jgi:hypothetical protein
MAIVKKSGITKRVSEAVNRRLVGPAVARGAFRTKDLFKCPRRLILSRRNQEPLSQEDTSMSDWKWRYLFRASRIFDVHGEMVVLGDTESRLHAVVDMVAIYLGTKFLVSFIERDALPEDPLTCDVAEMSVAMYLSGVWAGLLFYYCGDDHTCFFMNPDRESSIRSIVGGCADTARGLADHILHETTPSGEAGEHCPSCQFRESCDAYQGLSGAKAESERNKI